MTRKTEGTRMTDAQYRRLRAAVEAYARALQAYGLMVDLNPGGQWFDSDELDRLWTEVMLAADLPIPTKEQQP